MQQLSMAQSNVFGNSSGVHSNKRRTPTINGTEPPRKKVKQLLADDSSTSSDDDASGGALLHPEEVSNVLAVNQEYARRFEHNKRREELHRRM